jgi:cobalt-zinc-cadmium efflux system outer membrane protein
VEADRARNQVNLLAEQLAVARRELSTALQLPPETQAVTTGSLDLGPAPYTLAELQALVAQRPLLNALRYRESAARSRLALERATAYPDVTVGVGTAREAPEPAAREQVIGLSVSVPLPLFKRNRGAIGRAVADLTQAQVDRAVAERDARAAVETLWLQFTSARDRVRLLGESLLPRLEENQRLTRRSFEVGQIGITEVLLASRQVLDGRREAIEAQAELALVRTELEQASGWGLQAAPAR